MGLPDLHSPLTELVEACGGAAALVPLLTEHSTTTIIERIGRIYALRESAGSADSRRRT